MANVPEKMKAAQVVAHGKPLEIREVPVPKVGPVDILVKVEFSGVCHTDLHVQEGDWKVKCPLPMTPGHEGVGKVVALGDQVTGFKVGDRVCVPWLHNSCLQCEHCCAGWETVCQKQSQTGFSVHGGFAEYVKADSRFVGMVPDKLSFEQAAPITCAGVTVYKGLKVSEVKPGQWIVILGAGGGLGHVAVQYAKAMGMKVIGVDCGKSKFDFLKKLGVDVPVDAKDGSLVDAVKKATDNLGAHGSLILFPDEKAIQEAVTYLRPRGTVVPIALPPGDFNCSVFDVVLKAVNIHGSIVGTRLDLNESLEWAAEGKVKCTVQIRGFSEVNTVLDELKKGKINGRVVLDMSK